MRGERGPAHPAIRCGECHGALHAEWSASGHALRHQSAFYVAMRRTAEGAACDPCHAPLRSILAKGEAAADEGVTCEVCHTIKGVDLGGPRAQITLDLAQNMRWGALCDAQEHYFHKAACSPLFRQAEICAACHRWSIASPSGNPLAILTEYDEWRSGPAAAVGIPCQGCHMPPTSGEVATGWKRRAPMGGHGFMGRNGDLLRRAVAMEVSVEDRQGVLQADITVKHLSRGHAAPTGLPGRQLVLRVSVLDEAGQVTALSERVYGRVLVDASGEEVPFTEAYAEASDTRLAPTEARTEAFSLRAGAEGALRAEIVWRAASPSVAAALGLELEERVLSEARVPFGAPRPGRGRALLPKKVVAIPRPAATP